MINETRDKIYKKKLPRKDFQKKKAETTAKRLAKHLVRTD
jgi:hypothetical protein